jgi:hypothetical protein
MNSNSAAHIVPLTVDRSPLTIVSPPQSNVLSGGEPLEEQRIVYEEQRIVRV